MQPNKFETRLAALDALAQHPATPEHEADTAARRAVEHRARGLLCYAVAVRNQFVADACAAALAGDLDGARVVVATFHGVWSHPNGRAALLRSVGAEAEA